MDYIQRSRTSQNEVGILCQDVWKIFGSNPEDVFALSDNGMDKQAILEQTGHVVAVKDVSFEVHENERFTVTGFSGSSKSTLVMDEPFIALDPLPPAFQVEFANLQNTLRKTAIFTTHDLAVALKEGRLQSVIDLLLLISHPQTFSHGLYSEEQNVSK